MIKNETNLVPKSSGNFTCSMCDYFTSRESQFVRHMSTRKHKMKQNETGLVPTRPKTAPEFMCPDCKIEFRSRTTLWRHKKKCKMLENVKSDESHAEYNSEDASKNLHELSSVINENNKIDANMVMELIKQNRELQQQLASSNTVNNTTNNTTHNNQKFNINVFLNENCKDAINFSDFIENIQVSHDDLENNARLGFVNGISKIIRDNLQQYAIYERPIHCSDVKRDKMYIRDENKWEQEQEKVHQMLHKGIREVSLKSIGSLIAWKKGNPEYDDIDSDFSNKCIIIQKESLSLNEHDKYSKVSHNLAKDTLVS